MAKAVQQHTAPATRQSLVNNTDIAKQRVRRQLERVIAENERLAKVGKKTGLDPHGLFVDRIHDAICDVLHILDVTHPVASEERRAAA